MLELCIRAWKDHHPTAIVYTQTQTTQICFLEMFNIAQDDDVGVGPIFIRCLGEAQGLHLQRLVTQCCR